MLRLPSPATRRAVGDRLGLCLPPDDGAAVASLSIVPTVPVNVLIRFLWPRARRWPSRQACRSAVRRARSGGRWWPSCAPNCGFAARRRTALSPVHAVVAGRALERHEAVCHLVTALPTAAEKQTACGRPGLAERRLPAHPSRALSIRFRATWRYEASASSRTSSQSTGPASRSSASQPLGPK